MDLLGVDLILDCGLWLWARWRWNLLYVDLIYGSYEWNDKDYV